MFLNWKLTIPLLFSLSLRAFVYCWYSSCSFVGYWSKYMLYIGLKISILMVLFLLHSSILSLLEMPSLIWTPEFEKLSAPLISSQLKLKQFKITVKRASNVVIHIYRTSSAEIHHTLFCSAWRCKHLSCCLGWYFCQVHRFLIPLWYPDSGTTLLFSLECGLNNWRKQ